MCSPAYAAEHAQTLSGPVAGWSGLTLLDLLRPNEGWATWDDWSARAGHPPAPPRRLGLDSYTYLLEAAVAGTGIALGWRHFIEPFLEAAMVAPGRSGADVGNFFLAEKANGETFPDDDESGSRPFQAISACSITLSPQLFTDLTDFTCRH